MNNHETIIFGGSFNPPTRAHQALAEACLASDPAADVWLMPSGERLDKEIASDPHDRLALLELMCDEIESDRIDICTIEIENTELTQTFKTIANLEQRYPRRNFRFVYGMDAYSTMHLWEQGEELHKSLPLLLVPRNGVEPPAARNVKVLEKLEVGSTFSSTAVREAIQNGEDIGAYCCNAVTEYIKMRKMYVEDNAMA